MTPRGIELRRVWRFARAQAAWVLVGPALMLVGTTGHELAHAVAGVWLGGVVDGLWLLPSLTAHGFRFGWVSFAAEPAFDPLWMSLAPSLVSIAVSTLSHLLVPRLAKLRPWLGVVGFLFLFLLPLVDVTMAVGGVLFQRPTTDGFKALHGHELAVLGFALVFFTAHLRAGWRLFLAVFGAALSRAEFTGLTLGLLVTFTLRWAVGALAGSP